MTVNGLHLYRTASFGATAYTATVPKHGLVHIYQMRGRNRGWYAFRGGRKVASSKTLADLVDALCCAASEN